VLPASDLALEVYANASHNEPDSPSTQLRIGHREIVEKLNTGVFEVVEIYGVVDMSIAVTLVGSSRQLALVYHSPGSVKSMLPQVKLRQCFLLTRKSRVGIFLEFDKSVKNGGVAQMVEQAAHIRWVRGSSPFAAIFFIHRK
jgi:hypothetical protein